VRIPLVAAVLAACALAPAGCGDDDGAEGDAGGSGAAAEEGGGGGRLYGQGGGGEERGGGDAGDGSEQPAGPTMLRLAAPPSGDLAFDRSSLRARAGRVVIAFDNPSRVPHAVEVEGNGVEEETETVVDGSARLVLNVKAGEYVFYCPVGNHEQAGMRGTLTVRR
jgi:plastocyanin